MVDGIYASGDYFTTLGVPALLGRIFTPADDLRGGGKHGPVAVISYALWQRRFGGAGTIVGTPLIVERVPFTIIGVTPPAFFGVEVGRAFDVALPMNAEPLIRGKDSRIGPERGFYGLTVLLRLKPGQSIDAANALVRGVQPQIREAAMPSTLPPLAQKEFLKEAFTLVPAASGTSRLRARCERPLVAIFVLVALVLFIACANIATLQLARATARRHELSVRLALGAPRWRLAREWLVESVLLSGLGSVLGLFFAFWASRALVAQLSTAVNRVYLDLSLDWRLLAFTAAVAVTTTVLFGTLPAVRAARAAPIDALKEQGRGTSSDARVSLSSGLVVIQVALSLVIMVAAGLFVRTFENLATLPLGFDSDRVLLVSVNVSRTRVDAAERIPFFHRLAREIAGVPGVANAAASLMTLVGANGIIDVVRLPSVPPSLEAMNNNAVNRRRTEIGIRMALGAAPASVVRLVLARVSIFVGLGVLVGAGASVWASRFVAPLLYGLEPRDPLTLASSAAVLTMVGALAGWVPTRRATRIDPAEVLRDS